jgi:hypothetical protein
MGMDKVENGPVVYDRMRVCRWFPLMQDYDKRNSSPFRTRFVKLASRLDSTLVPIISIKITKNSVRSFIWYVTLSLVWDDRSHVPGRYTGRVPVGKGPGLNLLTRLKPIPVHTPDPYTPGGYA